MSDTRAWIYAAEYGTHLPKLTTAVSDALRFVDWLRDDRGLPAEDIYVCIDPRPADLTLPNVWDASIGGVYASLEKLLLDGRDQTRTFFGFVSGHGFEVEVDFEPHPAMVILGYAGTLATADKLRSLEPLQNRVARFLGGQHHIWFVDACRTPVSGVTPRRWDEFVSAIATNGRPRPAMLHAAAEGQTAHSQSGFVDALLEGLKGRGRAKCKAAGGRYTVQFGSLASYVAQRVVGQEVSPRPPPTELSFAEFDGLDVASNVRVKVDGLPNGTSLTLTLTSDENPALGWEEVVVTPGTELKLPPDDYRVALLNGPMRLRQLAPGTDPVDLYSDVELRFKPAGGLESLVEERPLVVARFPDVPVGERIRLRHGDEMFEVPGGAAALLPAGRFEVEAVAPHLRTTLASLVLERGVQDIDLRVEETSERHAELMGALGGHISETLGSPDSTDLAVWLLTIGAGAVAEPLGTWNTSRLRIETREPEGHEILFLCMEPAFQLAVDDGPWVDVTRKAGEAVTWASIPAPPGPHVLRFRSPRSSWAVGTWALERRITVVAVAQDGRERPRIRQLAPLSWWSRDHATLTTDERSMVPPRDEALRWFWACGVIQAHMASWTPISDAPDGAPEALEALEQGRIRDPLMTPLAAWLALRRGVESGERNHWRSLLDSLRSATEVPEPDWSALRTALGDPTPVTGLPWIAEALDLASPAAAPPGFDWLDTSGPWVLWRQALRRDGGTP